MKKIIMGLCLVIFSKLTIAQNGLEKIIVEKYYISNAADAAASVGVLPVGSVTYRIYVDMLPGYKFQAMYGVAGHELRFETNTSFFNNEDRGHITPSYTIAQAADNTVMLDSWLTVGGACGLNYVGVLKSEDNGVGTVVNSDGVLQNANPAAGIPLTMQDGLISGTPEDVTLVGFDSPNTDLDVFDATSGFGNLFSNSDGSIAALNGSAGPTASNRVLIAQLTTDGILGFELNIQIGTPGGGTQNYVAKNPVGNEIQIPSLINNPVTLNLKALLQGFYIGGGQMNASIDPVNSPSLSDSLIVELRSATGAHEKVFSDSKPIDLSGNGQFIFPFAAFNHSYYIAIHHRNSIETWSKDPVLINATTNYDFTSLASKAFGDNEIESPDHMGYTIYAGDINQDGSVDASDFLELDPSIQNGDGGYVKGDFNGDGAVDATDFLVLDPNIQNGVGAAIP